jgi:hypothetical protein
MSLVMMGEPGTFVGGERGKNPAQYELEVTAFKYQADRVKPPFWDTGGVALRRVVSGL